MNIKTTVVLIIAIIMFASCKVHKIKIENYMNTFDIKTFSENKIGREYNFTLEDGSIIRQTESTNEFSEYITIKNSYFELYKSYYKNGTLKMLVERFPNSFVNYIKEYDEAGNLISETDYRNDFKYTWKDLLKVLKRRGVKIKDKHTSIGREEGNWDVFYVKKGFFHHVIIDDNTGEFLKDAKTFFIEGS